MANEITGLLRRALSYLDSFYYTLRCWKTSRGWRPWTIHSDSRRSTSQHCKIEGIAETWSKYENISILTTNQLSHKSSDQSPHRSRTSTNDSRGRFKEAFLLLGKYRSQTGNSAQERISQLFESWKKKDSKCPLYRHSELYHEGREFPVSVKVLRNCFGDPTTRRITESILIDELSTEETMNAKGEWTYIKLNKITMQTWRQMKIPFKFTSF